MQAERAILALSVEIERERARRRVAEVQLAARERDAAAEREKRRQAEELLESKELIMGFSQGERVGGDFAQGAMEGYPKPSPTTAYSSPMMVFAGINSSPGREGVRDPGDAYQQQQQQQAQILRGGGVGGQTLAPPMPGGGGTADTRGEVAGHPQQHHSPVAGGQVSPEAGKRVAWGGGGVGLRLSPQKRREMLKQEQQNFFKNVGFGQLFPKRETPTMREPPWNDWAGRRR